MVQWKAIMRRLLLDLAFFVFVSDVRTCIKGEVVTGEEPSAPALLGGGSQRRRPCLEAHFFGACRHAKPVSPYERTGRRKRRRGEVGREGWKSASAG